MNIKQIINDKAEKEYALAKLRDAADRRADELLEARVKPLQEQIQQERKLIYQQVNDEFEARIEAAQRARDAAYNVYADAIVEARTVDTGWLPEGTKVAEWAHSYASGGRRRPTGRKGVVRVWSKDSRAPKRSVWSLPKLGEVYVRVLTSKGVEGASVARHPGAMWYAEGVDPNEQQEAA